MVEGGGLGFSKVRGFFGKYHESSKVY